MVEGKGGCYIRGEKKKEDQLGTPYIGGTLDGHVRVTKGKISENTQHREGKKTTPNFP